MPQNFQVRFLMCFCLHLWLSHQGGWPEHAAAGARFKMASTFESQITCMHIGCSVNPTWGAGGGGRHKTCSKKKKDMSSKFCLCKPLWASTRMEKWDKIDKMPETFHLACQFISSRLVKRKKKKKKDLLLAGWSPSSIRTIYSCAFHKPRCFKRAQVFWSLESFEGQCRFVVLDPFLLWQNGGGRDDQWCRVAIAPTLLINPKSKLCQSLTLKGCCCCVLCQEPPFLLSILIKCGSQGGSSLIMKGEMGAPEPRRAPGQSIFILVHAIIKDKRSSGLLKCLKLSNFFFSAFFYSKRTV